MFLVRMIVLDGLKANRKVLAKYVNTKKNYLADSLSRLKIDKFKKLGNKTNQYPDRIHPSIWPITKVWMKNSG